MIKKSFKRKKDLKLFIVFINITLSLVNKSHGDT